MAIIDPTSDTTVRQAFDSLSVDSAEIELTEFVATRLNLNPSQRTSLLPDRGTAQDDERSVRLDQLAGALELQREYALKTEARIPNGILFKRTDSLLGRSSYFVEGLIHFLSRNGSPDAFLGRVRDNAAIRRYLTGIGTGDKLEAIASSLLTKMFKESSATRRTADQGVDCFAHDEILQVHDWCCNAGMGPELNLVGKRVHIIASCKANEGNAADGIPAVMPPAHLRELIGSWLIQRTDYGMWHSRAAIRFLSPLQLLLVTTYRLSDGSLNLCEKTGVTQWGIPEIIYLFCAYAPENVFPAIGEYKFSEAEADKWIRAADENRAEPEPAGANLLTS
jgi:hypothetical protein